jgi:hypothetical protein
MRWCIAAVLVVAASNSHADDGDAAALDHLDRGIAAYRIGDYETAHRELGLAQELAPERANPYRWLALTEIKQGNCREALVNIEAFMSRVPVGDARVPEMVAQRQQCVQEAQVQPPPAPAPTESKPVYGRWWFWTAVGVVAVAAVGVTYAATRDDVSMLPPIRCNPGGCQ